MLLLNENGEIPGSCDPIATYTPTMLPGSGGLSMTLQAMSLDKLINTVNG